MNKKDSIDVVAKKAVHRNKLKKKLGEQCVFCNCNNKLVLTIDHILPLSRGGEDTDENKQVACVTCNRLKGSLTDAEFRKYMKAIEILHKLTKIKIVNIPAIVNLEFNQNHYPDFGLKNIPKPIINDTIKK